MLHLVVPTITVLIPFAEPGLQLFDLSRLGLDDIPAKIQ